MKKFYLTLDGKTRYQSELINSRSALKAVKHRIKSLRRHNEFKDSSDWETTQQEVRYLTNRISQLEGLLGQAKIIPRPIGRRRVRLGSIVHFRERQKVLSYQIVDSIEAEPEAGKISYRSPIGRRLLGRKVNDIIKLALPSGYHSYRIIRIA
ncbi:GreA/GreB family elongation factor [Candidatus Microgenomates bacterium]|nr:GreA/GreB family elongation factor [Candidatus Microgenomates bacterium]